MQSQDAMIVLYLLSDKEPLVTIMRTNELRVYISVPLYVPSCPKVYIIYVVYKYQRVCYFEPHLYKIPIVPLASNFV